MKLSIIIITFLISTQLFAQNYHPIEQITTRDGLSHRNVYHITKDHDGLMWISTQEGLNRYDGTEWIVYKHQKNDSTSISNNNVINVLVTENSNLYVNTSDKKRKSAWDYYDKKTNTFRRATLDEVQPLLEQNNEWLNTNHLHKKLAWLRTKKEKYLFKDLSTSKIQSIEYSSFGGYSLPIDKNGRFWYPASHPQSDSLFSSFQLPKQVSLSDWVDIKMDNLFNIWLVTKQNKVYKFDLKNKTIHEKEDFAFDDIRYTRNIFQDEEGTLWMPHRFGIAKARKRYKFFEHYFSNPNGWKRSNSNSVEAYSMVQSAEDTIYTLYGYGGVAVIPPDSGKAEKRFRYLNIQNKYKLLATDIMMAATADSSLWIGVGIKDKSLFQVDLKKRQIKGFRVPDHLWVKGKEGETKDWLRNLVLGKDGKLWFSQRHGQLFSFDRATSTITSEDSTHRFYRGVLGVDEDGLWICNDEHLYFWDYKKGLTQQYQLPDIGSFNYMVAIYKVAATQNKVWIGSRNGLVEFDKQSKKFSHYTIKDGLSNNLIYTIIPYGDNLWMGTHDGLSRFNIKNKDFKNYYQSDGLTYNEFNRESALKAKNGKLYFGGLNGINAFYPDVLDSLSNLNASPLVWTHFSKLDAKTDSTVSYSYHELDASTPIQFHYGDKSFVFRFALLSYVNPSKNSFYYMLDGYEKDWHFNKNTFFVNYASLPPGKYTLRVKAKDALGNFGSNELAIPIIVYGPWWKLWWVRSLFSLLAIGGIIWFFNRQITAFERKNKALEKIVSERTAELEKQKDRAEQSEKYKQQFLANMSHEIRTPMHGISGMVKILRRNQHPKNQDVFLDAMQISSDNLVVLLNDVLDLSKIEAGKLDIENIPMNPRDVIKNVVQILYFKAEEKGLVLYTEISEDIPLLVMGDPTRLNQVLINLVGNAIKFTQKGSVKIILTHENYHLKYSIQDTGIGIPKDKLEHIFEAFEQAKDSTSRNYGGTGLGLSISKQLTEIQGGTISVESEEGVGSTFYIQMPLILADIDAVGHDVWTEEQLKTMTASLKGLRILVAEDNDFNKMIAQDDLEYHIESVKIDVVENGKLAVEAFQNNEYDLILMDVQMPEMNGFEATRAIRQLEKGSTIPIIAMTASLLKTEIDSCLKAGMNSYIPKPYQQEELIGRIFEEVERGKRL